MSRFFRILAPLAIILVAAASGCHKAPENKMAGTYVAKPELTAKGSALIDKQLGAKAAIAKKQISDTAMNLELRSDMTFTMITTGPTPTNNTGKWSNTGGKVLLSLGTDPGGAGAGSKVMSLKVSPDLKTLIPETGDNGAAAQLETLIFNRTTPVPTTP